MVEIDLAFHRTMCELTGNRALLHSWEGIAGSIRMSIMFAGAVTGLGGGHGTQQHVSLRAQDQPRAGEQALRDLLGGARPRAREQARESEAQRASEVESAARVEGWSPRGVC